LNSTAGTYAESINDDGIVSGGWVDANGNNQGFLAYPNAALPVASTPDGTFVFDVNVQPNAAVFLDPPLAIGYRYAIGSGNPTFATVTLPIGIGDSIYTLSVDGTSFTLAGGVKFDFIANGFASGVSGFDVTGIESSANVNPASPTAFVTQVGFTSAGAFTGTMAPIAYDTDALVKLASDTADVKPGTSLSSKAGVIKAYLAAGDAANACATLAAFEREVSAQTGKKVGAAQAAKLQADADVLRATLRCLN
jgi:hypothetical protein